jgi:hypothetical protein
MRLSIQLFKKWRTLSNEQQSHAIAFDYLKAPVALECDVSDPASKTLGCAIPHGKTRLNIGVYVDMFSGKPCQVLIGGMNLSNAGISETKSRKNRKQ